MPKVGEKMKVVNVSSELEVTHPEGRDSASSGGVTPEVEAGKQEVVAEVEAPVEPVAMKPKSRAKRKPKATAKLEKIEEEPKEGAKEE